ncbi:TetR/AcrR family transcriptional regulator C-terminal domain-containing protein [Embleya hyalina]|uniref:TetR family transcriptional regulator n=1 Tax=Embleya hyalina TaxID=516124 RepID=A0A401YSG2_9ACTN|nr:TetR/AcrR family transcriptional regulator C-terminal domain-containing protein [Embleya hyalina]GCD97558.1 TetR family transcriptional regulator [Embleya hyalina]
MGRLSRARVLDAALALADRDGIAKLSMRRLGAELGVEAMTLYYYVPNKDAVLDGLVERIVASVAPRPSGPRAVWMGEFAHAFRAELLRHPAVVPLVATRPVATPEALAAVERAAAALVAEGLAPLRAFQLLNAVTTFVIGHTLAELDPEGARSRHEPPVATAELPCLAQALAAGLGTRADHDERFEAAIKALLAGIE